jgi:hypothetical protein
MYVNVSPGVTAIVDVVAPPPPPPEPPDPLVSDPPPPPPAPQTETVIEVTPAGTINDSDPPGVLSVNGDCPKELFKPNKVKRHTNKKLVMLFEKVNFSNLVIARGRITGW